MKVAMVTSSLSRSGGGITSVVEPLSAQVAEFGHEVGVFGLEDRAWFEYDQHSWSGAPATTFPTIGPKALGYSPLMTRRLVDWAPDIIHGHGIWMHPSRSVLQWANLTGKPYIVSLHGMLEPWAQKYHAWRKKVVWSIWQKAALYCAHVLHATSSQEAGHLRVLGFKNPIAIIPNGVHLPILRTKKLNDETIVLFLSRIHPKKGLLNLIKAWKIVRPCGWRLIIAGPDDVGHQAEVIKSIYLSGLSEQVEFLGPVNGIQKWELYRQADLFVLPSFSENFGLVVAEALASEVPVITTKGTPWQDLDDFHCGWWIDIGVDPLVDALNKAMALKTAQRNEMGKNGRTLVSEKYAWGRVSEDLVGVYQWMSGGGAVPGCVEMD